MHANTFYGWFKYVGPLIKQGMTTMEISPARKGSIPKFAARKGIFFSDHWRACLGNVSYDHFITMPDEYTFDCQDDMFDLVWSMSVIEHVGKPWVWVKEQARIVKPGGLVVIIGPFTWREHRVKVTVGRRDAWRVLPDGMTELFNWCGLDTVKAECFSIGKDSDNELMANRGPAIDVIGIGRKR